MGEILTIDELAALLKMTRRQIYEMTRERTRAAQEYPIPVLRINSNLRFRRVEIEAWILKLERAEAI